LTRVNSHILQMNSRIRKDVENLQSIILIYFRILGFAVKISHRKERKAKVDFACSCVSTENIIRTLLSPRVCAPRLALVIRNRRWTQINADLCKYNAACVHLLKYAHKISQTRGALDLMQRIRENPCDPGHSYSRIGNHSPEHK